jgi:hypothetical protein
LPSYFFCIGFAQDQNGHAWRGLKNFIDRLYTVAIGQRQVKHYRPDPAIAQPLDSVRKFGNPLHAKPFVGCRTQFV